MRRTLVRTAFNPVIYEVLDFGISMYDRNRRLISESSGVLSFLGANDYAIHKGVEKVGIENLHPGDVIMINYPYWSGAHVSDAMLFSPVFCEGSDLPDAYLAVRAHWMDLGAKDPGYVLDSTSMHQEGLIMPGIKLIRRGEPDPQIMALLRYNSRMPDTIIGGLQRPGLRHTGGVNGGSIRSGRSSGRPLWKRRSIGSSSTAPRPPPRP